jgi:hypothetical protein
LDPIAPARMAQRRKEAEGDMKKKAEKDEEGNF